MGTNRVEWIDTAKGMGIFLVILGHTGSLGGRITNYIYSFHMPLFFFLSGYLFSVGKYSNFAVFLKKKVKSLLIPYIIFSFGTYLFWVVVGNKFGEDSNVEIWKPFIGIFYSNGIDNWLVHNVPLWFLTCLFVTESMFYVLSKYVKHTFKIVISLVVFSILGYLDSIYMPFRFPWGMDVALTSTVFFGIGYIVKKNIKPLEINSIFKVSLIIVLVFLLSILELLICKLNGRVDMNLNEYGNYAYFYLGSLLGIFCWIIFSKFLSNINFIKYIGRNSLLILAVHQTCIMFVKGILVFGFKINLSSTLDSFYWALFYTVGTILIAFPIIIIVNKYVPFMVGRKYNLK